ncbi:MAG TPA: hypothetical protein VNB68_04175 [Nitrososphaeraceae archaeon]|nr:hypothetical protein [Nitrososphaeraceae archaeon]
MENHNANEAGETMRYNRHFSGNDRFAVANSSTCRLYTLSNQTAEGNHQVFRNIEIGLQKRIPEVKSGQCLHMSSDNNLGSEKKRKKGILVQESTDND